ncbi:MAG TPA: NAD-dependent epimerase/dehydratase family protein [Myxococcales bacterium]|nr:NAD-dependent epimerase/dehydratase family protein [Myxococcales bacterium]
MHVLITGGAGFIGAHSCRLLLEAGHRVTALDDLSHGKREAVPAGADLVVFDVRSPQLATEVQKLRPDAVLHLAAQMDVRRSVADPTLDASINVLGTVNLLAAARTAGASRFVFASSGGAVYGEQQRFPAQEDHPRHPASPYGVSKLCGEEYVELARREGLSTMSLRYANVYGPGQDPMGEAGVVAIFLHKMLHAGEPVINGDGEQTRDFVYVGDVARANVLALQSRQEGPLNVGTGEETSVNELARILARAAGYAKPIAHGPAAPGEQRRSSVDPAAAGKRLGWAPQVALQAGLRQTAEWFAERSPSNKR